MKPSQSSSVGRSTMAGPGLWRITQPSMHSASSVLPVWDAKTITTVLGPGRDSSAIGSARYGTRDVRHGPGKAVSAVVRTRSASAQSWIVRLRSSARLAHSARTGSIRASLGSVVATPPRMTYPLPRSAYRGLQLRPYHLGQLGALGGRSQQLGQYDLGHLQDLMG